MESNAIGMKLENTVFLITPVQFSVVKIVIIIIYPILKYSTKYFIFCHVHVHVFFLLILLDFAKFY